jgi:hypothetical protein
MGVLSLREFLQQQVATAPDDLLPEIANFIAFVVIRHQGVAYVDWTAPEWRDFTLSQFVRETEGDVEYSLEDAQEIFHS